MLLCLPHPDVGDRLAPRSFVAPPAPRRSGKAGAMDHMPLEAVQAWPAKAADALGLEGQTTLSDPPCGGKRLDGSSPQPENNAERKSIALLGDLYELFAIMSNT